MFELKTRENRTYFVSEVYDNDLTTVTIIHLPTGVSATGNAKRLPEDIYDPEIGRNIAYYRALSRLGERVVKRAIKNLSA